MDTGLGFVAGTHADVGLLALTEFWFMRSSSTWRTWKSHAVNGECPGRKDTDSRQCPCSCQPKESTPRLAPALRCRREEDTIYSTRDMTHHQTRRAQSEPTPPDHVRPRVCAPDERAVCTERDVWARHTAKPERRGVTSGQRRISSNDTRAHLQVTAL